MASQTGPSFADPSTTAGHVLRHVSDKTCHIWCSVILHSGAGEEVTSYTARTFQHNLSSRSDKSCRSGKSCRQNIIIFSNYYYYYYYYYIIIIIIIIIFFFGGGGGEGPLDGSSDKTCHNSTLCEQKLQRNIYMCCTWRDKVIHLKLTPWWEHCVRARVCWSLDNVR